jgi:hypothetical protein
VGKGLAPRAASAFGAAQYQLGAAQARPDLLARCAAADEAAASAAAAAGSGAL